MKTKEKKTTTTVEPTIAVYVGRYEYTYRRMGRTPMRMSHMASPDLNELHRVAERLGLRREWFQDKPGRPHYDINRKTKQRALAEGLVQEVSDRELMRLCFPEIASKYGAL